MKKVLIICLSIIHFSCEDNRTEINCLNISSFEVTHKPEKPIINNFKDWNRSIVVDPTVVKREGKFYMWYTGAGTSKLQIGLATSENGKDWIDYIDNPVLTIGDSGDFDMDHLRRPFVVYDNKIFKMWYNGFGPTIDEQYHYSIGYAESKDGINWTKHSKKPVLDISKSNWDNIHAMVGSVLVKDNRYHMWYGGFSSKHNENLDSFSSNDKAEVGYAFSSDGINWIKNDSPVMHHDATIPFESYTINVRGINWNNDGNYFEMFYMGKELKRNFIYRRSVGRATSLDGIKWKKDDINPIITTGLFGDYDDVSIAAPVFLKNEKEYMVYYSAQGVYTGWNIGFIKGEVICN